MPVSCSYCNSEEQCKDDSLITPNDALGPSIEDIIMCLLFLLANKLCENLGIVHKPSVKGIPCEKVNNFQLVIA